MEQMKGQRCTFFSDAKSQFHSKKTCVYDTPCEQPNEEARPKYDLRKVKSCNIKRRVELVS